MIVFSQDSDFSSFWQAVMGWMLSSDNLMSLWQDEIASVFPKLRRGE
jgi:hypothetical protein